LGDDAAVLASRARFLLGVASGPSGSFHIGRLGMSSFDSVDMLLVKRSDGKERLFWRTFPDLETLHTAILDEDEMESVARDFCTKFEHIYPGTIMAGKR
jgi:hypothetical protein